MKKRSSREINVFNMSMLDVICCALGAFVILILMADFNRSDAVQTVKKLQDEIRHYSKANRHLRKENKGKADLEKENEDLKEKVAQGQSGADKLKDCQEKLASAEEARSSLTAKIDIYGDPLSGSATVILAGRKTTGSNQWGTCIEKFYTCRRTYQRQWCAGPGGGVSRWGGGGN